MTRANRKNGVGDNALFKSAWDDYRLRRRWLLVVSLGGLLVVPSLTEILPARVGDFICPFFAAIWFIASSTLVVWFGVFRCPRCGHCFFITTLIGNPYARRCI
ncbi:MAG: hypothetical protein ABSG86_31930, partial [Thermoguttaceae bacterium]